MKRVAIIAPDFVPSSLPPAIRVRFFVRHLPEFGWQPVVISTDPSFYDWSVDAENEKLLQKDLEVIRTAAAPAALARHVGIGCIGIRSLWHHWRALSRLCQTHPPDLVFVSVPPYVSMILGRLANTRFGIPYVIDYIDPWVTDYYNRLPREQRPPKWFFADRLSRVVEPLALRRAAHVVAVSKGTTDPIVERCAWLNGSDATEIPYGAEAADFQYLRAHPRRNSIFSNADGFIHMTYVGRAGTDMEFALRIVFQAIRRGLQKRTAVFQRLRLHFVGTTYAANAAGVELVLPLAAEYGLEKSVTEHSARVPYLDALQLLQDSDALLAIGSDSPHYTASKVFPYVLAQKPLLAVFRESSTVVNILSEAAAGVVVAFDPEQPSDSFVEPALAGFDAVLGSAPVCSQTRWDLFESYTAKAMAGRLAGVFDRVLGPASATCEAPAVKITVPGAQA